MLRGLYFSVHNLWLSMEEEEEEEEEEEVAATFFFVPFVCRAPIKLAIEKLLVESEHLIHTITTSFAK